MKCCRECFKDPEVRAAIEMLNHKGNCPICKRKDVWIYDSDIDEENSYVEELLDSILEIYCPKSELPDAYPEEEMKTIEEHLSRDWYIFSCEQNEIKLIVEGLIGKSLNLSEKLLQEKIGIPQLFDENYLDLINSIMGHYKWKDFKKYLRNENRFHSRYIHLDVLEPILKVAKLEIPKGDIFYRARVSNEKGAKGFSKKEMWAPPDDVASAGRANSKGQSCLYLSGKKETTIKEIRAHAFDYVTIANFRLIRNIKILDLNSITHISPFNDSIDKIAYLVNERTLKDMETDFAKPMSRWDSELDYLPTQYMSDYAKFLGYDGVKYFSTFDKDSYNIALFDSGACECISRKNYLIGDLDYKMTKV